MSWEVFDVQAEPQQEVVKHVL
ncbi:MAG: hypothetical protein RLZZ506_1254, partial [Bacteroidota bacterium]